MRFYEFKIIEPSNSSEESVKYVLVQKRDSLYRIAKALNISLPDLIAANPQIKDPDLIHPGDKIKVPDGTFPNPIYPEIPHSHRVAPKDDGSFDSAEKNRLGNYPEKALASPVVPPVVLPKDTNSNNGDAGRGKVNPGPVGKGAYQINDPASAYKVFSFFKKNGFNDVQAAAFTGNAYYESKGLNTSELGDYDELTGKIPTSAGIFQWHLTRWAGLRKFALTHRKSWKDLDLQLEWTMEELNTSHKGVVSSLNRGKGKTDIAEATLIVMNQYEAPKAESAHYDRRLGYAKVILDAFGTKQDKKPA